MENLPEDKVGGRLTKRSFEGWDRYPMNLPNYDRNAIDGEALNQELSSFSVKLFCEREFGIDVDIFDVEGLHNASCVHRKQANSADADDMADPQASRVRKHRFSDPEEMAKHILYSAVPNLRVISITQTHSLKPLKITEEAMRKILTYHSVTPDFLTNLFCCGDSPQISEAGSGHYCTTRLEDGSLGESAFSFPMQRLIKYCDFAEMMYTYKYVERNGRSQGNNWSIRQTTVYHQHAADGTDTWIILHPRANSVFETRLFKVLSNADNAAQIQADPNVINLLLLSSYNENWRWYLGQLSETFQNAVWSNIVQKALHG